METVLDFSRGAAKLPAERIAAKAQTVFSELTRDVLPLAQAGKFREAADEARIIASMANLCVFDTRIHSEVRGGADLMPLLSDRVRHEDEEALGAAIGKVLERGAKIDGFMTRLRSTSEQNAGWLEFTMSDREYHIRIPQRDLHAYLAEAAEGIKRLLKACPENEQAVLEPSVAGRLLLIKCEALCDTLFPNISSYHNSAGFYGRFTLLLNERREPNTVRDLSELAAYSQQIALACQTSNI